MLGTCNLALEKFWNVEAHFHWSSQDSPRLQDLALEQLLRCCTTDVLRICYKTFVVGSVIRTWFLCIFARFWVARDSSCRALGRFWAALGRLLDGYGRFLSGSWAALGSSWAALGRSWATLGRLWQLLGGSGRILGDFQAALGRLWTTILRLSPALEWL